MPEGKEDGGGLCVGGVASVMMMSSGSLAAAFMVGEAGGNRACSVPVTCSVMAARGLVGMESMRLKKPTSMRGGERDAQAGEPECFGSAMVEWRMWMEGLRAVASVSPALDSARRRACRSRPRRALWCAQGARGKCFA